MRVKFLSMLASLCFFSFGVSFMAFAQSDVISLPAPRYDSTISVEVGMAKRATFRNFRGTPLTLAQASQLLWSANGNRPGQPSRKVIPSAGALYPLEIYLVAGQGTVGDLPAGIYNYDPSNNSLKMTVGGDKRQAVASAALSQMWLSQAPAIVVIAAVYERTTVKYGERGIRYVHMESGCADQNLYLQAIGLGVKAGTIGAFDDDSVSEAMKLPSDVKPLLLVGVGQ